MKMFSNRGFDRDLPRWIDGANNIRIPISQNEQAQGAVDSRRLWYFALRKYGLARTKGEMEARGASALPLVDVGYDKEASSTFDCHRIDI
jgi:hypothetical protein